jgi:YbgC/YbaW family acyl-CoA thioester hydrolase
VSFAVRRAVRFQDVDAAGLVFHPRVLEYFHDAFVEFLAAHGQRLDEVLQQARWGAPLRHAEADYLAPLRFGDEIEVALVKARLEQSEVRLDFRVTRARDDEVAAVGHTVHVFVDARTFRRRPVPDELRVAFESLGGG